MLNSAMTEQIQNNAFQLQGASADLHPGSEDWIQSEVFNSY